MSALSAVRAGRAAAERLMTDTWAVYREGSRTLNDDTGQYDAETTTVYLGPAKLQSFEAYEQTPEAAAHEYTVMRPVLHLPVTADSAQVAIDDYAVCLESVTDEGLVGTKLRIAGKVTKTYMTARRFPVVEVLA